MLREGPIPAVAHGLWEYLGAAGLIVAPLVVNYSHGAATAVSIVLGVLILVVASMTDSKTSLVNQLPLAVHIVFDYALAAILIGSPFLFGFSGEGAPTAIFIAGGVVHLLVTIGTRFQPKDQPPKPGRIPGKGELRDDEIPEFEPPSRSG